MLGWELPCSWPFTRLNRIATSNSAAHRPSDCDGFIDAFEQGGQTNQNADALNLSLAERIDGTDNSMVYRR